MPPKSVPETNCSKIQKNNRYSSQTKEKKCNEDPLCESIYNKDKQDGTRGAFKHCTTKKKTGTEDKSTTECKNGACDVTTLKNNLRDLNILIINAT